MAWTARAITSKPVWLLVVLAVALPIAWWQVTERAVSAVEIRSLTAPVCTGTTVERRRAPGGKTVSAIRLTPDMSCRLNLEVANNGSLPVFLDTLVLPLMGPAGGAAVQVDKVWIDEEVPVFGQVAGEVTIDRRLDSDEKIEVEIQYGFRQKGCTAAGLFWVPAAQTEPSLLLRSTVTQADPIYFAGTSASAC